jgi:hypothetical protein
MNENNVAAGRSQKNLPWIQIFYPEAAIHGKLPNRLYEALSHKKNRSDSTGYFKI